jgi:UDP-2,3-diacylglucosamine pyrophosphatase LpxH
VANKLTTVLVGDTHIGHQLGLMSDTAKIIGKTKPVEQTPTQEVTWDFWKEFTKKFRDPDCLLLMGDLPDMLAIRRKEEEMWTHNSKDIRTEAKKLFSMFGKPKKTFVIKGTPAHVDAEFLTLEEDIAEDLGAEMYRFKRAYPYRLINLAPEGGEKAIYHVTHHISSTTGWYRGTAPAKAMASLMLNESHFIKKTDIDKIVGLIRGHVHHFWYEESVSRRMIINPCWQGPTGWMIQKMPETPPDIGSVVLHHYSDGAFNIEKHIIPTQPLRPPVFQA